MSQVTVISTKSTAYGPARKPFEVKRTRRVAALIRAGIFYEVSSGPEPVVLPAKMAASAPVTGVTAPPPGTEAITSSPIDQGEEEEE